MLECEFKTQINIDSALEADGYGCKAKNPEINSQDNSQEKITQISGNHLRGKKRCWNFLFKCWFIKKLAIKPERKISKFQNFNYWKWKCWRFWIDGFELFWRSWNNFGSKQENCDNAWKWNKNFRKWKVTAISPTDQHEPKKLFQSFADPSYNFYHSDEDFDCFGCSRCRGVQCVPDALKADQDFRKIN